MTHVAVIGGGIGGVTAAYELRHRLRESSRITLVSDRPDFQFTPSNPWVAVGWRAESKVTLPLAPYLERHGVDFIHDGVIRIRPDAARLELASGESLAYDYAVIATGPDYAFDRIPGLGPDVGHSQSVCTTAHAMHAHAAFQALCREPGPVVVGAAQGASCFGPAYEYAFVLDHELRRRGLRAQVPITLITPEPYIGHLGLDGVGNTAEMLTAELRARDIPAIANARTTAVTADTVHVETVHSDGAVADARELPAVLSMIIPPFRGVPAVADAGDLVNDQGFVVVDDYQRSPIHPNVYAVGVSVAIPPVDTPALPCGVPKTGFMIETMANAAASNIADDLGGREPRHVPTWNAFCLADYGNGGAAILAIPQTPPRSVNFAVSGRWAHYAKIAYEWYFMRKLRKGLVEPFYEKWVMRLLGANKVVHRPMVETRERDRSAA